MRPPADNRDDLFEIPTGWRSREHAEFTVKMRDHRERNVRQCALMVQEQDH